MRHSARALLVAAVVLALLWPGGSLPSASAKGLNLHRGSTGEKVLVVERRLDRLGLLRATAVNRRYTRATFRAVKRFQVNRGLRATGRVNARTWRRLARAAAAARPAPTVPRPAPATPAPVLPPLIVGHRGAVVAAISENTLESMRYAVSSADVLEFDLRFTADGATVLLHDSTLDRTTNCTGPVVEWTLAALREQCTVDGEPIPTFDEVAAFAATASTSIAPQIGPSAVTDEQLTEVADVIAAHGLQRRTYVQSFFPEHFPVLRAHSPDLRFVYLTSRLTSPTAMRAAGAVVAGLHVDDLSLATVSSYQRAGLKVWGWTADTVAELTRLRSLRVDGVFTDIPRAAYDLYH